MLVITLVCAVPNAFLFGWKKNSPFKYAGLIAPLLVLVATAKDLITDRKSCIVTEGGASLDCDSDVLLLIGLLAIVVPLIRLLAIGLFAAARKFVGSAA